MATPNDPTTAERLKYLRHLYGNFTRREGEYWFEWTPFTPAVLAWQSAERYLQRALDDLHNAQQIYGFALPGLETEFDQFKKAVQALTRHVEDRRRAARSVTSALDAANTSYARVHDATAAEYQRVMGIVNAAVQAQGRRSPVVDTLPVPGDPNGDRRVPLPLPTGVGFQHGN